MEEEILSKILNEVEWIKFFIVAIWVAVLIITGLLSKKDK